MTARHRPRPRLKRPNMTTPRQTPSPQLNNTPNNSPYAHHRHSCSPHPSSHPSPTQRSQRHTTTPQPPCTQHPKLYITGGNPNKRSTSLPHARQTLPDAPNGTGHAQHCHKQTTLLAHGTYDRKLAHDARKQLNTLSDHPTHIPLQRMQGTINFDHGNDRTQTFPLLLLDANSLG